MCRDGYEPETGRPIPRFLLLWLTRAWGKRYLPLARSNQPFVEPRQVALAPQIVFQAAVLQWDCAMGRPLAQDRTDTKLHAMMVNDKRRSLYTTVQGNGCHARLAMFRSEVSTGHYPRAARALTRIRRAIALEKDHPRRNAARGCVPGSRDRCCPRASSEQKGKGKYAGH